MCRQAGTKELMPYKRTLLAGGEGGEHTGGKSLRVGGDASARRLDGGRLQQGF